MGLGARVGAGSSHTEPEVLTWRCRATGPPPKPQEVYLDRVWPPCRDRRRTGRPNCCTSCDPATRRTVSNVTTETSDASGATDASGGSIPRPPVVPPKVHPLSANGDFNISFLSGHKNEDRSRAPVWSYPCASIPVGPRGEVRRGG